MKQLSINVVSFNELSKEAKKTAKENIQDFLFDVLAFHVKEIKESKDEYLKAYHSGKLLHLNKDENKNVFSDEYVADLCEGNEIYFLENGTEYCKIESLLKGLI